MLQFQCPHCTGIFQIDASIAGQQVGCPLCGKAVMIGGEAPPHSGSPPLAADPPPHQVDPPPYLDPPPRYVDSPPAGGGPPVGGPPPEFAEGPTYVDAAIEAPARRQLGCPLCGGPFEVTAEMAGQQVACPHCGSLVSVPADSLRPQPAATDPQQNVAPAGSGSESDAMLPVATAAAVSESLNKSGRRDDVPAAIPLGEATKKIVIGDKVVEIRRLTPEERAKRRLRRNLIMIAASSLILVVTLLILSLRQPPQTDSQSPPPDQPGESVDGK